MVPAPVVEAMFGMATSRVVMAGVRLGFFAELAKGPVSAQELSERRGAALAGTHLLLECLAALGHVQCEDGGYRLTARAAKWLDPKSPTYVGDFLEFNYDQWD